MAPNRPLLPLLLAALFLVACSKSAPPTFVRLALLGGEGPEPVALEYTQSSGRVVRVLREEDATWLSTVLRAEDWQRNAQQDALVAQVSIRRTGHPKGSAITQRLTSGETEWRQKPPGHGLAQWTPDPGTFHAFPYNVCMKPATGSEPPAEARLDVYAERRRRVHGCMRFTGDRYSGEGFALWPGETLERVVDLPAGSALRFATTAEPAVFEPGAMPPSVTFHVELDGEPIFESTARQVVEAVSEFHVVELPEDARAGARLSFSVQGDLAYAAFLDPVVGPSEIGRPAERPWTRRSPDIVVFLADTFRADNMEAYGGTLGLTPYLDELAQRSRVFQNTWSVATFTLPAHVSMFAGLYPQQVGMGGTRRTLPGSCVTIAELLGEAGYRTGAITESVMVTHEFGLDQGFARWDEARTPLDQTLERARAFLDADDGRPIFLFVQTYRTHIPYQVSSQTKEAWGERLDLSASWQDVDVTMKRIMSGPRTAERNQQSQALLSMLRDQYRGTVVDLDRGFEEFHGDLIERGYDRAGYLVFTSDHGEAFNEHGVVYHPGKPWDELARVPMLVHGPNVPAEVDETSSSLVDLAPTLAELAGIDAPPSWVGRSFWSSDDEPPLLVIENSAREDAAMALIEGQRKVMTPQDAEAVRTPQVLYAYDLGADPKERNNVGATKAWPLRVLQRHADFAARMLTPVVSPEDAALGAKKLSQLRAMGYLGDE